LYGWPRVLRILKAKKLVTLNINQTENNICNIELNHVTNDDDDDNITVKVLSGNQF